MAKFAIALLACGLLATASALPQMKHHKKSFETMIVGGEPAVEGELPYQVSLRSYGGSFHFCGGSVAIVGDTQLIVTAAHCVVGDDPEDLMVIAGDLKHSDTTGHEQRRQVTRVIAHEGYSSSNSYINDIALLLIDQPFELNEFVAPIPLPKKGQQTTGSVVVSGWGTTSSGGSTPDTLQKVEIPTVSDADCQQAYADETIHASQLCAGLIDEGGKDSCQGDSGGPLRSSDGGYLAAIVSWGYGCARPGYPGVNTEVSAFIDWIEGQVAKL